jgi:hypothetical protein
MIQISNYDTKDIAKHLQTFKNSKMEKIYYNELIFKSKNKTKTPWKIVKKEIGSNCQDGINL